MGLADHHRRLATIRRAARTSHVLTRVLGPTHRTALDLVEIDLTFACNLRCFNCDRSCTQAEDMRHMGMDQIVHFLAEIRVSGRFLRRIRILGGEPTLHPRFDEILDLLVAWRDAESPLTVVELVSNGHGDRVRATLDRVPVGLRVKDTAKTGRFQPKYEAFNLAPVDDPLFSATDFRNGCWITQDCGLGLNTFGWYPCSVAGGIDRVFGEGLGLPSLPRDPYQLLDGLRWACARCGHFKTGKWTDPGERDPVVGEPMSRVWQDAYVRFRDHKPPLPRYGSIGFE